MTSVRRTHNFRALYSASLATFSYLIAPVFAADHSGLVETSPTIASTSSETIGATLLEPVVVTGSHLQRVDVEGPLPVAIITRKQIDQSGEISVTALLRNQAFNSFGSRQPGSGTGASQGGAQINLRGLGAERTLVLIDGRRLPNNPAYNGASQNINNIPLALVDRIEVLRDGASAIYGSDAIGGVVNIITKTRFDGLQLSGQIDRPSIEGGDASTASLTGGLSNEKGKLYFALEHYDKNIINGSALEPISRLSIASGYPGTIYQYDASGVVVAQPSDLDANGNPRNFRPFDSCPRTGFGSNAEFPYSNVVDGRCRYNTGNIVALTADVKRNSLTLGGNYALPFAMTGFGRVSMVSAESFGRFPAAAVDSLVAGINSKEPNGNIGIRIAPDNPNNPNPGSTLVLNYTPTVLGTRDYTANDQVNQFLLGVKGDIGKFGFKDWEMAVSYDAYLQNGSGINNGLVRQLQQAVDEGRFNPFAPDASVANEFRYTTTTDNHFISKSIDGKLNYEFNLNTTTVPIVFGVEYRDDDFAVISDAQSAQSVSFAADGSVNGFQQSNVFGTVGGTARGARSHAAAFAETAVQLYDNKLELGFALRFDNYSDVGHAFSTKWSAGYRPFDNLLLRICFGEGFRAPDLSSMYGAPAKATPLIIDRVACVNDPNNVEACSASPQTIINDSNAQLKPEESKNLSAGFVWNASQKLSLTVDYYSIKVNNAITRLPPQAVFDNELRCKNQGRNCNAQQEGYVVRNSANGLLFAYSPIVNAAKLETSGVDIDVNYGFDAGSYGRYTAKAGLARTLSYKRQDAAGAPLLEQLDTLSASTEIFPKFRSNAMLTWAKNALDATLGANYISAITDCDATEKLARNPYCSKKVGSFLTFDTQFGVTTPWQQHITIGIRNIFDKTPKTSPHLSGPSHPGTFYALHNPEQRVLYLRLTQNF